MNWYFQDSKSVQGPLTELQLRAILNTEFEQSATVRSEGSNWISASLAKAKFTQLEKEGIYLRSQDKIFGPFVRKKAEELRTQSEARFDSYKIGMEGRWIEIEKWTTSKLGNTTASANSSDEPQSSPIGIKEAVTPLISFAKQSAEKVKADPRIQETVKETKHFVKSKLGIKLILGTAMLLLISVVANKLLFNRNNSEERLKTALSGAIEDIQAEIDEQKQQYAEATVADLGQAATEIERIRATIKETRIRSKQKELERSLRDEFESMSIRLEGELHILEEKEKARQEAEIRRSQAKQKQEQIQIAATEAQAERKRLCERLFLRVDVNPEVSVRVADILAEFKASLELRGADYEQISKFLKDQNWLGLINTLLKKNYTELPETQIIESAVETLANYDFQILLRIVDPEILKLFENPDSEIKIITSWVASSQHNDALTLCDRQTWTKHPDGIGLMQEWKPSQGRSVVTLVRQKQWRIKQKELSDTYDTRVAYLKEKSRIGEIPSDLLNQFYENLRLEFLQLMTGWALGQNPFAEESSNENRVVSSFGQDSDALAIARETLLSQFVGKKLGAATNIPSLDLPLRWIAPGKFEMGSDKSEVGRGKNENRVKVSITEGFWMGETEVTQGLWKSIMNTEPWQPKVKHVGPRFPATCVSWNDCREFTRRLSTKARRERLIPSNWEFSLPTEAQWELACRGGSDSAYSFGNEVGDLEKYACFKGMDSQEAESAFAKEVATKQPNQYGLFDMHGNVMEWCLDSYSVLLDGGINPILYLPNSPRILRGGSSTKSAVECRSASREAASEDFWESDLGLRLVLHETVSPPYEQRMNKGATPARYPMKEIIKPKEGFYVCTNTNETTGDVCKAGLVISGDLIVYTVSASPTPTPNLYQLAWVRLSDHPLEKRGFIVYERPVDTRELMVIERCNGSELLVRYVYAKPTEQIAAFDQPSLYPPSGAIVGQWKNGNVRISGPGPNASSPLKKVWSDLQKKHAPRSVTK